MSVWSLFFWTVSPIELSQMEEFIGFSGERVLDCEEDF